jgi:hypothetical protein
MSVDLHRDSGSHSAIARTIPRRPTEALLPASSACACLPGVSEIEPAASGDQPVREKTLPSFEIRPSRASAAAATSRDATDDLLVGDQAVPPG